MIKYCMNILNCKCLIKRVMACLIFVSPLASPISASAEETITGVYSIQNAVEDYRGTRFFEISRNQYQEYIVTADRSFESVAYYDAEHHELFCVIETAHQYNTLMKFRIEGDALTVYSLYSEKWNEYPGVYKK